MTYQETVEYLYSSAPLFQNVGGKAYKDGLDTTIKLIEYLGNPHIPYKKIHVGGTNGKGSCSHTLASILQKTGYKVGLYTSPHLLDFRERIRINGAMIPKEEVVQFVENHRSFFEPLHPSFFELTTALAFSYFKKCKVDVAVIEVGLGGRLDCTNIIHPDLSIITNISFDHTQFLGSTLESIGKEKAGIIKANTPVVIGETLTETHAVFTKTASEMNAPIWFAQEETLICNEKITDKGPIYETIDFGLVEPELKGAYQHHNTLTILAALRVLSKLGFNLTHESVSEGFKSVCSSTGLRGRWEVLKENPKVICDTGHNVSGICSTMHALTKIQCKKIHILFGVVSDKDADSILTLLPKNAVYYVTKASVQRAMHEEKLMAKFLAKGLEARPFISVREAWHEIERCVNIDDVVYVGGSTFIVADFLSLFENKHFCENQNSI